MGRCCGGSFIEDVHFPRLVAAGMFCRLLDVRARRRKSFQGFLISKCARQMTRRQGDTESTIFDFTLHLIMNHHDVLREGRDGGSHLLCKRFH